MRAAASLFYSLSLISRYGMAWYGIITLDMSSFLCTNICISRSIFERPHYCLPDHCPDQSVARQTCGALSSPPHRRGPADRGMARVFDVGGCHTKLTTTPSYQLLYSSVSLMYPRSFSCTQQTNCTVDPSLLDGSEYVCAGTSTWLPHVESNVLPFNCPGWLNNTIYYPGQ